MTVYKPHKFLHRLMTVPAGQRPIYEIILTVHNDKIIHDDSSYLIHTVYFISFTP